MDRDAWLRMELAAERDALPGLERGDIADQAQAANARCRTSPERIELDGSVSACAEVDPVSDRCQRWRRGVHSWRRTSDGGFDPARYRVEPIEELPAKNFVVEHHYSRSYPAAALRFGLRRGRDLMGVVVLGVPANARVLTGPFPTLVPYEESLELSRLVLLDEVPANAESWFVARSFDLAAERGLRGVVAFADPVPRRVGDRLLFPGHVGIVYQALNGVACGRSTARTLLVLPDGSVLSARAVQKVRGQERGHRHVERLLERWGARRRYVGEAPRDWLVQALHDVGASRLRHAGNHRYCFRLGTRAQRRSVEIALSSTSYPKQVDR